MRDMLFLSKWFKGLEDAPDEVLQIIGFRLVKELIMNKGEIDTSADDWTYKKAWADIKREAVATYESYQKKREYGEQHGKKMNPISIDAWKYYQKNPDASAADVGEYLVGKGYTDIVGGAKKKFSKVYDLPGWKNRNNKDWLKELGFSENSDENCTISKIKI